MRPHRDSSEQFLAIFRAWRYHVGAPSIVLVKSLADRCLIEATDDWLKWLTESSKVEPWKYGIARHKPFGGKAKTAKWGVRGIRIFGAAQIIVHLYKGRLYLEIDFDRVNPGRGLLPALGHAGEWMWLRRSWLIFRPKYKTDPWRIARMMRRDGIKVHAV